MRELHHNIRNVSTVLDILEAGAAAGQRPFLRLATDHLRLLADRLEAASPPPSAALPGLRPRPLRAQPPPRPGAMP